MNVSVVVPVYNEEESLEQLDSEIRAALSRIGGGTEVIYVDDSSSDGSLDVLRRLQRQAPPGATTRIARLPRNFGQTTALRVGFELARGNVIVPLDADGQNNPADIPRLIARLAEGFDVVSGWRRRRQDRALARRLPSWAANRLISLLSGVRLHDYGCTLKAYRASMLKRVHLHGERHRFIPVFLARIGARITELEVDHRPRVFGESKYGAERVLKVLLDLVTIHFISKYFTRPMHFFGQAALVFALSTLLTLFFMVVFKFGWLRYVGIDYQASFIQTPLPALAATFLIGTVTALFFGILAEIVVHLHYENRNVDATWELIETGTPAAVLEHASTEADGA